MSKGKDKKEDGEAKTAQKSVKVKGNVPTSYLPSYVSLLGSSSSVGTLTNASPSPKSTPTKSTSSKHRSQPVLSDFVCPAADRESEREFYMYSYKAKLCTEKNSVECLKAYGTCPNYHYPNKRRRNPRKFSYGHEACPHVKVPEGGQFHWRQASSCPKGDQCDKSHTLMEAMYHPDVYKTVLCSNFVESDISRWTCKWRRMCAHAHGQEELEWTRRRYPRNNNHHGSDAEANEVDPEDEGDLEEAGSDEDETVDTDPNSNEVSDNEADDTPTAISQTPKSASSSSLPNSSLPSPSLLPVALPSPPSSSSSPLVTAASLQSALSKGSSAWTDSSKVSKILSTPMVNASKPALNSAETKLHTIEDAELNIQTLSVDDPPLLVERPMQKHAPPPLFQPEWMGLGMGTGLGVDLFARDSPTSGSRGLFKLESPSDRKPRDFFANAATIVPAQFSHVYSTPVSAPATQPSLSALRFGVPLNSNGWKGSQQK